jgi:Tfp pilus assembly protein PilV
MELLKINIHDGRRTPRTGAFSLIEALMATGIISVVALGLYAGISSGFSVVEQSRENLRATQILVEKMETVRLYSWDQINSNGFIPATFSAPFQPGTTNASNSTLVYRGRVTIANAPITEAYSNDLKLVTVDLSWISARITHSRTMSTLISRYGLQNYIYY